MFSRKSSIAFALVFAVAAAAAALVLFADSGESMTNAPALPNDRIPVAIFGDSDSHSFHDRQYFAPGSKERGGEFRSITFNWPEILSKLRGDQIDLGQWRIWGPYKPIAKARELLHLPVRRPRKEDFRYNFAINGAGCRDLNSGWKQIDRFLHVMALEPQRWNHGIAVIRVGVNDFAQADALDQFAADPDTAEPNEHLQFCLREIGAAVKRLQASQPHLRIVLVGIFDNSNWAKKLDQWQSTEQLENIAAALDRFDAALEGLAAADPNIAFFDDRAWFRAHWGSRDANGRPAYRPVVLTNGFTIENSSGDHPSNSVLADGHAGTVWNALWSASLVELVNREFGTRIKPVQPDEIAEFVAKEARESNVEL